MALIQPTIKSKKTPVRLQLDEALLAQVKAYCDWANIDKVDDFVEQAIAFVFAKDRDWKVAQSQRKPNDK